MNTNQPNQYGMHEGFHTHRSERYRHPEQDRNYRFDDYGSSARGGYGNESYGGTWGNQGNEMGGSRNISGRDRSGTVSTSQNYRNMGSYGGAQGRGYSGSGSPDPYYHFESGSGSRSGSSDWQRPYGYHSDYDSHGTGYSYDSNPRDLYGSDTSRRFQGSDQGRYDFHRERMQRGRSMSDSSNYWDRDNYGTSAYGDSEGSYMGSGYNRSTRGTSPGDYGSMGFYDTGSYGQQQHDPYARDPENSRIHHPDSDYDYDPNHAFDTRKRPDFLGSHNRRRTWSRDYDRERGFDRY